MTTAVNHRCLFSILGHSQASTRLSFRLSEKSDERKFPSHKDSALTIPHDVSLILLKFETEDPKRNDTQVNVALWFCSADKLVSSHQGERIYSIYLEFLPQVVCGTHNLTSSYCWTDTVSKKRPLGPIAFQYQHHHSLCFPLPWHHSDGSSSHSRANSRKHLTIVRGSAVHWTHNPHSSLLHWLFLLPIMLWTHNKTKQPK